MSQINTISTLNSTVIKKREIQEEIAKCGGFCKKRKMVREPTFCEHDHVLLEFPTWMSCVVIVWVGEQWGMWRGEHDIPIHSGGEVHIAYETGKSLFTCTLAGIRNTVLNLELVLLHQKCLSSNKLLLITEFFGNK